MAQVQGALFAHNVVFSLTPHSGRADTALATVVVRLWDGRRGIRLVSEGSVWGAAMGLEAVAADVRVILGKASVSALNNLKERVFLNPPPFLSQPPESGMGEGIQAPQVDDGFPSASSPASLLEVHIPFSNRVF